MPELIKLPQPSPRTNEKYQQSQIVQIGPDGTHNLFELGPDGQYHFSHIYSQQNAPSPKPSTPPSPKLQHSLYVPPFNQDQLVLQASYPPPPTSINLKKGESLYIKPFIKFSLTSIKKDGMVFVNTKK